MSKVVWIKKPEKHYGRRWWIAFLSWIAFLCALAVTAARVSRG